MAQREKIKAAYIDYVLSNNEQPKSVYAFAKSLKLKEEEFYQHFNSFEAIEVGIWSDLIHQSAEKVKAQEVYAEYSTRERILAFFFTLTEEMKAQRSFITYSIKHAGKGFTTPKVLEKAKAGFETFISDELNYGIEQSEIIERKFISRKYKDALWLQFAFIVNFWINDNSEGFEKTDEAIEKGINVTLDLMSRGPIDNLLEYGKFLAQHGKEKINFGAWRSHSGN
ncbi:TetR family transcriptional regulator C-terminal domain-containing protein [Solitalea sp. MAHUQ-68]|uniref:TetR family transcriptional regulator C-terminal domain-containing protein n=1 Tax=Solitalea agri TaxID=2953739 RepID=A0A9X2F420_9SPHI|nr:TetR family transcriptional regulator C-terminal domain-containing protein [Solitalea agri]MCO4293850.1 TetR family transcriptional regulator C-terminal domain-containing protein [Solitalea agri]